MAEIARIAEEVFWRDAALVDREGRVPDAHIAALADAGLFGVFAPTGLGGAGLGGPELMEAIELLASGCLATTFVWIQHLGLLGTLLDPSTPAAMREPLLDAVIRGEVRGGIALAGLLPTPLLRAAQVDGGGWRLDGESPWASGWGLVHLLLVSARIDATHVLLTIVDASDQPGLTSERLTLAAADASATVRLRFDGLVVPDDSVVGVRDHDPVRSQIEGLRANGSLALGITRRCCTLLGASAPPFDDALSRCRERLDAAAPEEMPAARAAASALAVQAAAAVTVAHGSGAAARGSHADRLTREAAFTLVFGSRPAIKAALGEELSGRTAS